MKYLTAHNFASFPKRIKPLPPDANAKASPCVLFQLNEHVEYRCGRCRRDGIVDDSVAVQLGEDGQASGLIVCVRCYSRVVRPKAYKPTRMVPFPSLLSWLNYQPAKVRTKVEADVMARTAEAVLPSGRRAEDPQLIGDAPPMSVAALPSTPMNPLGGRLDDEARLTIEAHQSGEGGGGSSTAFGATVGLHPCRRTFGHDCNHGVTCFFSRAPERTCLKFLMGFCATSHDCGLLHEPVFDLPSATKPPPRNTPSEEQVFLDWKRAKRNSGNRAEWQLWNQFGADDLVQRWHPPSAAAVSGVPEAAVPDSMAGELKEDVDDDEDAAPPPPPMFNLTNIRGALRNIRGGQKTDEGN